MKLPKADGTKMATMVTNQVTSLGTSKMVTRVRRTWTRSHGKIRIKSHQIKIRSPNMVTKSQNPRILVSLLLKM